MHLFSVPLIQRLRIQKMTYEPSAISADSFSGALFALEGIRDAAVLLNGPTGCKFYHGAISEGQFPRSGSMDPLRFTEEFYFGQPRIPATYLDSHDYVFGPTDKLTKILPVVAAKGHSLIALVNSPGAALIGDDLTRFVAEAGLPVPCAVLENPGFSADFAEGFQQAVEKVLEVIPFSQEPVIPQSVNLVGLSIFHRNWEGSAAELKNLLGLCGVRVLSTLCAGTSLSELSNIPRAACNAAIHGEFAGRLLPLLEKRFGGESILLEGEAPVGFSASEEWLKAICTSVGADPAPGLAHIGKARKRAAGAIGRLNSITGLPKGTTFGISGEPSMALPLTRWLHAYLGMVPVSVRIPHPATEIASEPGPCAHHLTRYLEEIGCREALGSDPRAVMPDVFFGSETEIAAIEVAGGNPVGIDIALPGNGLPDIVPKPLLGAGGALHILERMLQGLYRRYA